MTKKTNLEAPKQISHKPFVIRKAIVLSSLVSAIGGGLLFENPVLGMAMYFGLVALFDGMSHYILGLKSSDFANPEELLQSEKVTGEELDRYFDTRRNIRLKSFGIASFVLFLAFVNSFYPLEAFCLAYIVSTIVGILYVRNFLNIKRPRLIYRDASYNHPAWLVQRPLGAHADFVLWSSGHDVPLRF